MRDTRALRVVIYIRLSEETETTTSPARQRQLCQSYAEHRGWTVTSVVEDIDVSATHTGLDRPGLEKLRQLVAAGAVDVVVVWRLDRLARSVLNTLILLNEFTDAGVATASATEPIDLTTPIGKAMAALIAIFAEMEADAIKARVTGSIDALRKMGRFAGGTVPFGYIPITNPHGPGRVLVPDPTEAAIVQEAADLLRDGHSLGRVCRLLNERQIPAPRSPARRLARQGKPDDLAALGLWRTQSLRRLMTSDHLAGRVTHRGEVIRSEDGLPLTVWPPILSGTRLAHLREILEPDGDTHRLRRVRHARLLSGLARCSECESKLYVSSSGGRPLYFCPSRRNGVDCPSPRVGAVALERHVLAEALAVLGGQMLTRTVPLVDESANSGRSVTFREVEEAIQDTTQALQRDDADLPVLMARLASLKERRAELRTAESPAVLHVIEETGQTWGEAFVSSDDEARRLLLANEIDHVYVSPTKSRSRNLDTSRVAIQWTPDHHE